MRGKRRKQQKIKKKSLDNELHNSNSRKKYKLNEKKVMFQNKPKKKNAFATQPLVKIRVRIHSIFHRYLIFFVCKIKNKNI